MRNVVNPLQDMPDNQEGADTGWLRFNVRDADGRLLMLGNPVWFKR